MDVSSLISSGAQLGGSLIGGATNLMGIRMQNKANAANAKNAQDYERDMWNMNNAYNSPLSQMERFKQAGLNPNLIYGQGNPGNSSAAPKATVPNVENVFKNLDINSVMSVLSTFQQTKKLAAETDAIETSRKLMDERAITEAIRRALMASQTNKYQKEGQKLIYDIDFSKIKAKNAQELTDLQKHQFISQQAKMDEETRQLRELFAGRKENLEASNRNLNAENVIKQNLGVSSKYDAALKKIDYEMQSTLVPFNGRLHDSYWSRLMAKVFSNWGDFQPNLKNSNSDDNSRYSPNNYFKTKKQPHGAYGSW